MFVHEGIVLQPREDGSGLYVMYRPHGMDALLLGCGAEEALALIGRHRGPDGIIHQIAFARALLDGTPSRARNASWNLAVLLAEIAAGTRRAANVIGGADSLDADATALDEVAEQAHAAIGTMAGPRACVRSAGHELHEIVDRLRRSLAAFVEQLDRVGPKRLAAASSDIRELVETAWRSPTMLLERLDDEVTPLLGDLAEEPPLGPTLEAEGAGTVITADGRVSYGVRIAAGYVSGVSCTTPTDRLFKPGGVAARLLERYTGDSDTLKALMAALSPTVPWAYAGPVASA